MTTHRPRRSPETGGVSTDTKEVGITRALGLVTKSARPSGLFMLSGVEMWERFSFYGLQVLLAYYLYYSLSDGGLGLPQPVALGVAGSYGGLLYIAQIIGAWVADRVLAPRYVVLIGGSAIMAGHLVIALVPQLAGLICGLVLIVIGTGGLKVNSTMMVGTLYPEGGAKRDAGYSIFYMGITVGSFLGPLITGVLHQRWGFHVAFGAAAAGMAVGLIQYIVGMRKLPASTAAVPNPLPASARLRWALIAGAAAVVIALLIVFGVVRVDNISDVVAIVVAVAAVCYFVALLTNRQVTREERGSVVRYIPIFLMSLVFWTLLFQLFTAFPVFADTKVNLTLAGVTVSPTLIVTVNSLFVAVVTALLAVLWSRSRAARITPVTKLVGGVVFMVLGAAAIIPFSLAAGTSMPLLVAFGVMLLCAAGESLFAPAVLSVTSGLAPRAASAQMTTLYFLTVGGGSTLAGKISQLYEAGSEAQYFGTVSVIALVAIVLLALVYRGVDRAFAGKA
jgi:POT family proton-dependent oligopeptide transporter